LLEHVNQFMSKKSPAILSAWPVLLRAKSDLGSRSISSRTHRVCRAIGSGVRVDAYFAKVVTEARFHEGAGGRVERLAGRAQRLMDDGRGQGRPVAAVGPALQARPLLAALLALAVHAGRAAAGALTL